MFAPGVTSLLFNGQFIKEDLLFNLRHYPDLEKLKFRTYNPFPDNFKLALMPKLKNLDVKFCLDKGFFQANTEGIPFDPNQKIERVSFKIGHQFIENHHKVKSQSLKQIIGHAYKFKKSRYVKYIMIALNIDVTG